MNATKYGGVNARLAIITFAVLFALFSSVSPLVSDAQTTNTKTADADLLSSIRAILDKSYEKLSSEIQNLRSEVQALREEVRQQQNTESAVSVPRPSITSPIAPRVEPLTTTLKTGDSGDNVKRLQEVLIYLGFDVPAGATGQFQYQTVRALREVQRKHGLRITGELDSSTLALLNGFLESNQVKPPRIKEVEAEKPLEPVIITKPVSKPPVSTAKIGLLSPQDSMLITAGAKVPIIWEIEDAPAGAWVSFRLVNKLSGAKKTIHKSEELAGTYEWKLPTDMPSDNEFIVELFPKGSDGSQAPLKSRTVVISILGGTTQTATSATNTTTSSGGTNTSNYQTYVDFYKGTAFTTCMKDYPQTIALISSWLDKGWSRYQFPWGEITGTAATKVAECEGNKFTSGTYGGGTASMARCTYPNASVNGTPVGSPVWCERDYYNCHKGSETGESISLMNLMLGAPSSCESGWSSGSGGSGGSGGWSSNSNWTYKMWSFKNGTQQGSYILSRTDSEYTTFINGVASDCAGKYFAGWKPQAGTESNWQEFGIPSCSTTETGAGGSSGGGTTGGGTSTMYKCFYTNATINGTPPGYTVWCEKDYYNCRKGDPSGEVVSLQGLSLGAPSQCESGGSTSGTQKKSFLANVFSAIGNLFGF